MYKTKLKQNGNILKKKVRLVVKCFNQKQGMDHSHTFSPIAKLQTIRLILGVTAIEEMHLV